MAGGGGKSRGWGEATLRAKVAAAPFTTIDPNVGVARFAVPCAHEPPELVAARAGAAYGRAADGRRLLPCTLIDVAGLVPGAYCGKGKGNQFLADLCTADALIHVVDASGMTDQGGHATFEADALSATEAGGAAAAEVEWVHREIHLWVFKNLQAKLSTWRKRPEKLVGMFTGYGCSPLLVEAALKRAASAALSASDPRTAPGGGPSPLAGPEVLLAMARLAAESEEQLHRIAAHFVVARWPICLALNKSDHAATVNAAIEELRRRMPSRAIVATSARAELALLETLGRSLPAGCGLEVLHTLLEVTQERTHGDTIPSTTADRSMIEHVLSTFGTTGVLDAISRCVQLRPPVLCFPTSNFSTLAPLTGEGQLPDCVALRPLSTVGDAYAACKRLGLCSGDFVRAEGARADSASLEPGGRKGKPLKKDDVVGVGCSLLRLQSTRRSQWQN